MIIKPVRRAALLVAMALLGLAVFVAPAWALPPGWSFRHITLNAIDETAIDINGSNLLYVRFGSLHETCDILLYSTGTGTTRTVAEGLVLNGVPVIEGTWVVYSAGADSAAEIYAWSSATGTTRRITNNAVRDVAPSLHGSIVAWQRHDGMDWEICWIDLSGGSEQHFPNNFVDDFDPHVGDDWIAYRQEDPLGETGEVYVRAYSLSRDENVLVTATSDPAQNLQLYSHYLAFECTRDFPTRDYSQIMLYDFDTRTLRALTTDLSDHFQMNMAAGYLAYVTQRRGESDSSVVVRQIARGAEVSLTFFPSRRAQHPAVSQRWVIFDAWDGSDWEMIGYHIPTRRLFQITMDGVDNLTPHISGDRATFTSMVLPTSGNVELASFSLPFIDVPFGHRYRTAVENLYFLEIMSGYDATHFGLNDALLRQQFAKMIVLTTEVPCSEADHCRFVDVEVSGPSSLYPDNYVEAAAREGLTRGTSPTRFSPYAHISRVQVMTMVVRAAQRFVPGGLIEPPADWRGHFAGFTDPTHGHNAKLAEYNGLLDGIPLDGWDEWADATRGEVAQMLWNLWWRINCSS